MDTSKKKRFCFWGRAQNLFCDLVCATGIRRSNVRSSFHLALPEFWGMSVGSRKLARPNTKSKVKRTLQAIFRELGGGGARVPARAPRRWWPESARSSRWSSNSRRHHRCPQGEQSARRAGCSPCGLLWWVIRGGRRSDVELSRCSCGAIQRPPARTLGGRGIVPRFGARVWWSQGRGEGVSAPALACDAALAQQRVHTTRHKLLASRGRSRSQIARAPLRTYRISA